MNKPVHLTTFADLLTRIDADLEVHPFRAGNLKSSIRRLLRVFGWPDTMEASIPRIRRALNSALPSSQEVSKRNWGNTKSDIKFVLHRYGAQTRAPLRKHLTPEWTKLRDLLDGEPRFIRGLSNFMHFCSALNISPDAVSDQIMLDYHQDLKNRSLKRNTDQRYRNVCKLWNDAIDQNSGWPQCPVTIPSFRKTISLPWGAFPSSFLEDIEKYRSHMSMADLLDENALAKPLEQSTIHSNTEGFRRLASAIVRSGVPEQDIKDLSCLVEERYLRAGLHEYKAYLGNLHCGSIHNLIGSLASLAKKYLKSDPATIRMLRDLRKRIYTRKRGMTKKNIDRLHQFTSLGNIKAFISLGDALIKEAKKIKSRKKRALRIQTALIHEIMLVAPLRAKNLTELRMDQHFNTVGKGNKKRLYLYLSAEDTKNDKELEFEFPSHVIQLYEHYVRDHRPALLIDLDDGWLWPGQNGGHKNQVSIGDQLTKAVKRLSGITINPHLYRHIAGYLYLRAHPGEYETVRLLLGHASVDTTIMYYAGFNDTDARGLYAMMISGLRLNEGEPK